MKAAASDSATGWTVVEPASVISPESSPEVVGVAVGAGLEGDEDGVGVGVG